MVPEVRKSSLSFGKLNFFLSQWFHSFIQSSECFVVVVVVVVVGGGGGGGGGGVCVSVFVWACMRPYVCVVS